MPSTAITNTFSANTKIKSAAVNTNFNDNRTFIGALFYKNADQTNLTNGANTKCTFQTEVYDIGNHFSTASSVYLAPVDGYYRITGLITLSTNLTADKTIRYRVYINGTGGTLIQENFQQTSVASSCSVGGSIVYYLSALDTVGFYAFHDTGVSNVSMEGGAVYKSYGNVELIGF